MTPRWALLALGACALIAARPPMRVQPNPSAVIAADIAFNRLAQVKGQWTAYRETAAKDAVLFVPEQVPARAWLKGRADPPSAAQWSTSIVYVACDGRRAASLGRIDRPGGKAASVTTIWRLDDKGDWRWVARHEGAPIAQAASGEHLVGKVATCKRPDGAGLQEGREKREARPDESLLWSATPAPDGRPRMNVQIWTGEAYETVIDEMGEAGAA